MVSHTFEEGGVPPLPGFCVKLVLHTFEEGGGPMGWYLGNCPMVLSLWSQRECHWYSFNPCDQWYNPCDTRDNAIDTCVIPVINSIIPVITGIVPLIQVWSLWSKVLFLFSQGYCHWYRCDPCDWWCCPCDHRDSAIDTVLIHVVTGVIPVIPGIVPLIQVWSLWSKLFSMW